jgi:hypothetical protein
MVCRARSRAQRHGAGSERQIARSRSRARIFSKIFSRWKSRRRDDSRVDCMRFANLQRAAMNFFDSKKMPVLPNDFHFFQSCVMRAARDDRLRDGTRRHARRRRALRDTAFFPSKMRKFACRIRRNAYHDRMKRVNSDPVVKSTGD